MERLLVARQVWIGGGKFDNTNNNGLGVFPNQVGSVWYTDTTISYDLLPDRGLSAYFSINWPAPLKWSGLS